MHEIVLPVAFVLLTPEFACSRRPSELQLSESVLQLLPSFKSPVPSVHSS